MNILRGNNIVYDSNECNLEEANYSDNQKEYTPEELIDAKIFVNELPNEVD